MTRSYSNRGPDSQPRRQRGFSLWELAVLLGILGVAIVAGFALLRADRAQQIEDERMAQLTAADRALAGFIVENGRLPCPDTTGNGLENCGGTAQKGWLPVVTLGLNASAPARGVARLQYIVYRGAGADLTVLADLYVPFRFTSWIDLSTYANLFIPPNSIVPELNRSTTHAFVPPNLNTLDFCAGLTLAANATAGTGASATSAHIPGASGATVNVAYALAESGIDVDGNGNLFDGLNASAAAPVLESPARASDTGYDDIVRARSFFALGDALKCPQATHSVDAISHAVEVGVTVIDFQVANLINGGVLSLNAGIAAAMNVTAVALTIGAMIEGAATLTKATTALAADTAACAACVVLVGCAACAKIPIDSAAIALATTGLVLAAASVAFATTVGIPLDIFGLAIAVAATAKAGVILAITPTYPPEMLAELQAAATKAEADATKAEADALAARNAAAAALTNYNNSVTNLYAVAGNSNLSATLDLYKIYYDAWLAYKSADEYAKAKRKEAVDINAAAVIAEADAAAHPADATKQKVAVDLRARATALATAATQAEQDAALKLTAMNTAWSNYETTRDAALAAYPPASQAAISAALNSTVESYNSYMNKKLSADNLTSAATTARATATSLRNTYNSLVIAPPAGTTGGPPVPSFPGANAVDILRRADEKGALQ